MFYKKLLIILFLLLLSNMIFAFGQEALGFYAIKGKYIDVDVNITLPVNINKYEANNKFTLKTPIFSNSRTQKVDVNAFYYDSNLEKVYATIQEDQFGNSIAVFDINEITKPSYIFYIQGKIKSENKIVLNNKSYNLSEGISDYNEYKLPTKNIQSNSSQIISLAQLLKTGDDALTELVNITNWVHQNIQYDLNYADVVDDAIEVLNNRKGVCDEFAILEAAILRARGFPVRYISGIANTTYSWESHAWLEVYIPHQGWIPVDPTYAEVGFVDASHIVIAKAKDPSDIEDRIRASGSVDITFLNKKIDYKMNEQKSYSDMGYNNFLNFELSSEQKMKEKSLYTIQAKIKNTTANPICVLTILETHESFKLLYPNSNRNIVYLKPFEEKTYNYHYLLPDINYATKYSFNLVSQLRDINSSVSVYPNSGLFEEAFFVSDPIFYFKDKSLNFDLDIFNYTSEDKQLIFDFNFNGKHTKENQTIASNSKKSYTKSFKAINSGTLDLVISGDYDFSKSIVIYPDLKISEVVDENSMDTNVNKIEDTNNNSNDYNIQDIWKDTNDNKLAKRKNKANAFIPVILIIMLIGIIISIVISKKSK